MATLDGHYIMAEDEDPTYGVDITSQPVDKGADISDHVQRKPIGLTITGYVVGPDAAKIKEYLKEAQSTGKFVNFNGRNSFYGLISSLSTKHNKNVANGFTYSLTLTEIIVASSSYVERLPLPVKAQAAPIINSGTKQTKSNKQTTKKEKAKKKTEPKKEVKKQPIKETVAKAEIKTKSGIFPPMPDF